LAGERQDPSEGNDDRRHGESDTGATASQRRHPCAYATDPEQDQDQRSGNGEQDGREDA
jgi:hypothetical protein